MMFLLKKPTIIANIAAIILGLFSKSNDPALSKNIGGKIIAGKIAAGTKESIFFVLSLKISLLSKKIIENLVKKVIIPEKTISDQCIIFS
tara:strand:+ start:819 stop:1088 length:270 start_codon:yes stop_codon:yes gene_type:complete